MGLFDKIKEFVAGEEESPVTAASVLAKVREKYPHLRGIDDLSLSQSLYKKDPAKFSYLKTYAPDMTVPPALVPKSMRDDAFYKANPQEGTKDALKVIEQVKAKFPKYKSVDAKKLAVALETKNPTMFAGLSKKLMPGQTAIPKGETEAATIPLIPSGTMGATKPVSPVQVTPPVRPIETKPEPKVRPSVTSISPEEAKLPDGTKPLKFKNGIEAYLAVEKLAKPTLVEYPGRHGQTIRRIMTTEIPSFPPPPEDKGKDLVGKIVGKEEAFARGVGVSGVQIPELAYGATALVADSAEKLFGSGTASRVKDWALRGYQRASKVSEEVHGDEVKSVVESWKEAKKGNLDALGDWVSYAMGYGAGQLGESAAVAFLGGLVGSVVPGPGTAAGAVAGVTAKTATKGVIRGALERLVERQALKLTAEGVAASEAKKLAVKQIATAIGAASAIGAYAVVQEGGSIYPDAVKKAEEDGRKLNGYDLGRAWGTTLVAAGADGLWDMLGLGFLTGKVRIPGRLGKVARIVGTAVSGGLAGSGTESIQTAVERVGAGRKPFDQEGIQAIIESAAAGAIPGLGAGGVGATISGQPRANVQSLAATQEASPELLSYLDRVEKINRAQASDVTESQQKEDVTKGPARAEFIGYQEGLPEDTPIPLYNVMGESPRALSTVGSEELKSLGIETPKTPSFEEWKAGGDVTEGQVSAKKLIEKLASANEISDAVAVEFVKHITPTGENFYKSYGEEFSPEKFRVLGATIPQYTQNGLNFAIKLAQGAKESTGAHEMFHAMKQMGFFSQDEMRVLEGRFGNEEKIADALGEYATRRTGAEAQSRIKAIFDRFLEFVKRVGSMLVGRGWTRPEDIFESVVKGRPGKRASGSEGSTRFSAPPQEPVFYSQLQRTIEAKMPNSAPVEQVKGIIGGGAVKQDEIDWSGVNDFLEGKKTVTKAELLDFLKGNQVQVKEVVRGQREPLTEAEKDEQIRLGLKGHLTPREKMRYDDLSAKELGKATKFASYQLPGGENYREVLLTLPIMKGESAKNIVDAAMRRADELDWDWSKLTTAEKQKLYNEIENRVGGTKQKFISSHFDEPNILAHVRMNDRTTADGKKVLFLEEIQSDWHQQGRDRGYGENLYRVTHSSGAGPVHDFKTRAQAEEFIKNSIPPMDGKWEIFPSPNGGVPNAPFKKTWHELALKRMLRYAVDNGYDAIAWTTGEQQVKRYPEALRQVADHIEWDSTSDGKGVSIYKNGARILEADVAKDGTLTRATVDKAQGKHLSEVIGKTMAQKVIDSTHGKIKGEEFTVGGEGMKGFYDQIIPSFLNKYTKKWGGRVGETKINIGPSEESRTALQAAERTGDSALIADALGKGKDRMETVHSLDITPSMRENVAYGQPMFQAERIPPTPEKISEAVAQITTITPPKNESDVTKVGGQSLSKDVNEIPIFQGGKRELASRIGAAALRNWTDQERRSVTSMTDAFGGSGGWGLWLANHIFPGVKTIRLNELDGDRLLKIKYFHDHGNELRKAFYQSGLDERLASLYDEMAKAGVQSGSALGNRISTIRNSITDETQRAILAAIEDYVSHQRGVRTVNDAVDAAARDADYVYKAAAKFRARGGKFEYVNGDAYKLETPQGPNHVVVFDPPYYGTAGYGTGTVPISIYRMTGDFLRKTAANKNNIVYTDSLWMAKPANDLPSDWRQGALDVWAKIKQAIGRVGAAAGKVGAGRREVIGLHNAFKAGEVIDVEPRREENAGGGVAPSGEVGGDEQPGRGGGEAPVGDAGGGVAGRTEGEAAPIHGEAAGRGSQLTPETPGSPYFAAPSSNAHRRVPPPVLEALQSAEGKLNDLTVGQAGELSTLAPTRAMEVMDGKRFGLMKDHFLKPIQDADKSFQIELKSMRAEAKAVLHGLTADERRSVYNAIDLKHPIHSDEVKRAVDFLRKTYDDLLDRINTARAAAGKDPVQKRQNYITHYQELSVLNDILDMIGLNMTEVPNSMLTISMFTKPNSPYFQFAKRRLGEQTERDAEQAFLRYLEPALRTIHFSPATKNARDIIEYKVKIPSEYEGGKIDTVSLFGIRYPNAYRYLTNYLNVVSGKRPILDKIFPQGAAIAGVMNKLFAAGSIGGNISTVITQAASLRNTIAETGLFAFKGQMLINTPKGYRFFKKNSRIGLGRQYEPSTKGTRLLGSKALAKTHEAVSDLISIPVGLFDREMVGGAFLAGYFKGRSIGLSEADAIRYGDDVAERTQASANIVDRPPINTGKLKTALGQFQTFVYNEWSQIRNDMVKKAVLGENSKQGYGDGLSGIREGRDVGFKRFLYFSIAAIILSSMYDEADLPNPLKQEAFSLPFGNHHVNTVFQHIVNQIPFVGNIRFGGPPVVQMIKLSVDVFGPVRDRKIALRRLQNLGLRLIPGGGQISKSINAHRYFFKVPPQTMADKVRGYMFGPRRWKILNDDMRWLKENAGRLGLTRSKAYQYLNRTSTRSLLAETEKERTEARAKVESYAKRLRAMAESREAELLAREERRKARLAARR